ncbi:MAG: thiamine biosynthesis protein ThiI [Flavobacteriaceae bacterium]|jgi:thiamine biosynthesis protein ThiI
MTLPTNQPLKPDIETVFEPALGDIVVDIRHPQESADAPLAFASNRVLSIPFFNLEAQLPELDKMLTYLIYCDKGIMSRLQANIMWDHGFKHIAVMNRRKSH